MKRSIQCLHRSLALTGLAVVLGLFTSCQSSQEVDVPESAISKVDYFHLKSASTRRESQDPMIYSESAYYLHGALTTAERLARVGNYYTVYWETEDEASPVTVQFFYRQANSGSDVKTLEKVYDSHDGDGAAKFAIIGDDYAKSGRVISWKATVQQNGAEIGSQTSFLWK